MLFNEIAFQIQGFTFILHYQKIHRGGLSEHFLLPKGARSKILSHSLLEAFRLPNIENHSTGILEKIDSRLSGKMRNVHQRQKTKNKR